MGVADELCESRNGVDAVVGIKAAIAMYLNQQMLTAGLDANPLLTGQRGELALEFSGVRECVRRRHGV